MSSSNKHLRVALVGLGEAGFTIHLPALASLSTAAIVGACDLDPARRDHAATRYNVPVFSDYPGMLREVTPDVVVIGTPPESHLQGCLDALQANAHVICEKPFVPAIADADTILAAARRAGRQVAVHHQFREMPIFRALLERVHAAGVQSLGFVQVWQLMDVPAGSEVGWRGQMRHRTLYEAGVHLVDYVLALFGEVPVSVQAMVSSGGRGDLSDAVVNATLEFSGGRLAQLTQNRITKSARRYFEVRAELPRESLRASFGGRSQMLIGMSGGTRPSCRVDFGFSGLAWSESGGHRRVLARNPRQPMVLAARAVFAKTLHAFATGTEPPTSGQTARDVLAVISACYHSAETGNRVRLDDPAFPVTRTRRLGASAAMDD